jgi:8-oxo-dGTP pyrophosphatase MutT (NUDIX family)
VYVGPALLLLRASYRREWNFPGGGVRRGEAPMAAALRELAEETGIVADTLEPAGEIFGIYDHRRDTVHFFTLRLAALPALRLDYREIVGARLVPLTDLAGVTLTGPVAEFLRQSAPPPAGG